MQKISLEVPEKIFNIRKCNKTSACTICGKLIPPEEKHIRLYKTTKVVCFDCFVEKIHDTLGEKGLNILSENWLSDDYKLRVMLDKF